MTRADEAQLGEIIAASARYNIGSITAQYQHAADGADFPRRDAISRGFSSSMSRRPQPVFADAADQAANDVPVFRVSTEMWTIEYQERGRNTIIRAPGRPRPCPPTAVSGSTRRTAAC